MAHLPRQIDVHTHYFPPAYLKELEKGRTVARVDKDRDGNTILLCAGDYNVLAPGHVDLEQRLLDMANCDVDACVLSTTTPGIHIEERETAIALAQAINDSYAELVRKHPGKLFAYAALPLNDPQASADELDRAVRKLGLQGAQVFANVNGRYLDGEEYLPLWAKAAELEVPIFVHPAFPPGMAAYEDYRLVAILGFAVDTSLSVSRLLFSGLFERLPKLRLHVGHLGGVLPYMAERMDRAFAAYKEVRERISRRPSEIMADHLYLDTVHFDQGAIKFAAGLVGWDRLLLGSDYPHQVGDLVRFTQVINYMDTDRGNKESVLWRNAARLMRLE